MRLERDNTVAIIGGLGRMGTVTQKIFKETGFFPIISDIKDPTTLPAREAIRQAKIIFFSVLPIESIEDIIRSTADVFDKNHVVLDNASVKNPLKKSYEMLNEQRVSICSTHPLCKEDQPLFGQNVLIAPFGKKPQEATLIAEQIYQNVGMILIRVDFDSHDSLLLINQLLPHIVNRAVGIVLAENNVDPKALDRIATANSQLFTLANWRTLVQNPLISATLVKNLAMQPEGEKIIRDLQEAIARIMEKGREPEKLTQIFADTVDLLDPTGTIRVIMNDATITILERLANLKLHAVTIETEGDRPGLLRTMLAPFEAAGINLNAIDSRRTEKGIRFDLGIESGTMRTEVIRQLEELGFHVTRFTAS